MGKTAGSIDHATLAVGAGTDGGVDYFRVKNSWGTGHGEAGYFRVKRSTNPPQLGVPGGVFGVYDGADTVNTTSSDTSSDPSSDPNSFTVTFSRSVSRHFCCCNR